jgi:polysaccharide biosynthesis PFTS motif protein
MKYDARKQQIKSQIAPKFGFKSKIDSVFIDLVADKLAAEEFNNSFYRGEGVTNSQSSSRRVNLSLETRVKGLLIGIGISCYAIYLVLFLKSRENRSNSTGLVFAIPPNVLENRESIKNFQKYLDLTLMPTNTGIQSSYLVQSGKLRGNIKLSNVIIVPHVGSEILRRAQSNRFIQTLKVLWRTLYWLLKSFSNPLLTLIGPEFIIDYMAVNERRDQGHDLLITTQSQLLAPALFFRTDLEARKLMFWYSDNSTQISRRPLEELDYSYLTQPLINEHYVWTLSWKKTLAAYNPEAEIKALGPVIFRVIETPEKAPSFKSKPTKRILIFDVTPKKLASPSSIYSEENMRKFLFDIVDITDHNSFPVSLILKPKRKYLNSDSAIYLNEVTLHAHKLSILQWNCDIVKEINHADLVICIPFTSPALISSYLGVPTVFYTPTSDFELGHSHEGIPVLQGRDELEEFLEKEINKKYNS